MAVKTKVLNCHHCGGAIETPGDTMRVDCPYCQTSVWAPLSAADLGEAAQRLMQILQTDYAAELIQIEQKKSEALQTGDRQTYKAIIADEARLHADAFAKIDYWKVSGLTREDFIAQHIDQSMVSAEQLFAQASPESTDASQMAALNGRLQQEQRAYSEALERQDARAFATHWRNYMELNLRQTGAANLTEEEIEYQILRSMETMLRDQDWVGPRQLDALGFETLYDAEADSEGQRTVECQNCSAPLEVDGAAEFAKCPFCDATTHLQLTMSEQAAQFAEADPADSAPAASDRSTSSKIHGQLTLAKNAVASSYPDTDISSPPGRVLTYYFLQNIADALSPADKRAAKEELHLGEGSVSCSGCATTLAEVSPPLEICVVCQQPL